MTARDRNLAVQAAMTLKPAFGQPCNGCGMCCIAEQCALSLALFNQQERCPALEEVDGRLACGLVRSTADYVPDLPSWGGPALTEAFALMLGAGAGCDGQGEGKSVSFLQRWRMRQRARQQLERASPEAQQLVAYFRGRDAA